MSTGTQLSARDRIMGLFDEYSFVEIGAMVHARNTDFNMAEQETPADGVLTGYGTIDGKLAYVYSQDASVMGGSVGEMHAKKIVRMYDMALKMGAPVIGLIDCAGMRLQEATDALNDYGFGNHSSDYWCIWNLRRRHGACAGSGGFYFFRDGEGRNFCKFSGCFRWKPGRSMQYGFQ